MQCHPCSTKKQSLPGRIRRRSKVDVLNEERCTDTGRLCQSFLYQKVPHCSCCSSISCRVSLWIGGRVLLSSNTSRYNRALHRSDLPLKAPRDAHRDSCYETSTPPPKNHDISRVSTPGAGGAPLPSKRAAPYDWDTRTRCV